MGVRDRQLEVSMRMCDFRRVLRGAGDAGSVANGIIEWLRREYYLRAPENAKVTARRRVRRSPSGRRVQRMVQCAKMDSRGEERLPFSASCAE